MPVNFINSSQNAVSYLWDFGTGASGPAVTDEHPQHIYPYAGTYMVTLIAYSYGGCPDTFQYPVFADSIDLFVPNVFTPNGDGINDYWEIGHFGLERIDLLIFSRWGMVIYEASNPDFRWDGTYKDVPVPEGVYVYLLKATGKNGRQYQRKGTITVLR